MKKRNILEIKLIKKFYEEDGKQTKPENLSLEKIGVLTFDVIKLKTEDCASVAFSVKPLRQRRGWGAAEANLAQILRGAAKEYLSQIRRCQGNAVLQFILQPPGSIWRAGSSIWKAGGGIWRVGGGIWDYLTIWVLNLKIICEDLKLGGV